MKGKTKIIIGVIFLIFSAIILISVINSDWEDKVKEVPCVDGSNNLIKNLPKDIVCERISPTDAPFIIGIAIALFIFGVGFILHGIIEGDSIDF